MKAFKLPSIINYIESADSEASQLYTVSTNLISYDALIDELIEQGVEDSVRVSKGSNCYIISLR